VIFTDIKCLQLQAVHHTRAKKTSDPVSTEKRAEIVSLGLEENSWKVAAKKYGVSAKKVALWAKQTGKKLKFLSEKVDIETKDKILKYGVRHNSWKKAARKFAITLSAVSSWAKKAGLKLKFLKNKNDKCVVCNIMLAKDESLDEHMVVAHITVEGCCNICGDDSEDLVDHIYNHMNM
jgi:hypothetical protein